jgi:oxygen-independent coproporphyrinogen-3 oxidase
MFGIYIHIPYCRTVCPYCDFVKKQIEGQVPERFVAALCEEVRAFDGPDAADSVFFGGGTPSLLPPAALTQVLDAVQSRFQLDAPEVTLEANPDDITPELVSAWRDAGVNRVSLGVQSFDDAALRYLGRRHDAAAAERACALVASRFDNWSMDFIFGAPPVDAWPATLRRGLALGPPHVSAYGLTYEPTTPFGRRKDEAVTDDVSLALYQEAEAALSAYNHYEVSNFALPGREALHNLVYWRNEEYAGFGPGAYSFVRGVRARNLANVDAYCARPGEKGEALTLTEDEVKIETLIQHFRLRSGLPKSAYAERFGTPIETDFGPQLRALVARGLLCEHPDAYAPTPTGF